LAAILSGLVLLTFAAAPAGAHTGTASVFFQNYTTGPFTGATWLDPKVNVTGSGTTMTFNYHIAFQGCTGSGYNGFSSPDTAAHTARSYYRYLDSAGAIIVAGGAWTTNTNGSGSQNLETTAYCGTGGNPAGQDIRDPATAGMGTGLTAAAAGVEIKICLGNTSVTCPADVIARTSTSGTVPVATLTAVGVASGIKLDWTTTSTNATAWTLQRSVDGIAWATIETFGGAVRTFTDVLAAGAGRHYRLSGTNSLGVGPWSNTASATAGYQSDGTPYPPPEAPGAVGGPTGADPDEGAPGTACNWYNFLCQIQKALRWAFVPSEATNDAWETFKDTASERPPVSVALAGVQFVTDVHAARNSKLNSTTTGSEGGFCIDTPANGTGGRPGTSFSGRCVSQILTDATGAGEGKWGIMRAIMALGVYGTGAWSAYKLMTGAFSPKTAAVEETD